MKQNWEMMRRILSLTLAILLVLSCAPAQAFATETVPPTETAETVPTEEETTAPAEDTEETEPSEEEEEEPSESAEPEAELEVVHEHDYEEEGSYNVEGHLQQLPEAENLEETPWKGRSAVFVGDSITAGVGTTKLYYQFLDEELGFGSVTAMGVSGSCISAASDYGQKNQPLINRYQNIPSADLIIIFMGTNDYGHETPLGSATDTQDGTFYGALNTVIPALVAKHTSSKIVFVTSLHRYGYGTSKILGTRFTYDSISNGVGASLEDYVNAMKEVCAQNGVSVIDLHTECTLDPSDAAVRAEYMPDGIHPNAAGHEVIAGIMESHIRTVEPAEGEPVVLTEMVQGNKFASGNNQPCRASSRINYYLKAGTVITLKNPEVMQWACARTSSEFSSDNLGYFPEKQWTDIATAVVAEDGWIGFTFKYRDETQSFNLSKPLSDYITIHTHSYGTAVTAPTCTEQGYTTYTCACGDSYVDDFVDAAGEHAYKNGICTGCGVNETIVPSSDIDLFVFAGQSNMMGASILEPKVNVFTEKAWEYKYMPKLRGAKTGAFVSVKNPAGEWHYIDLEAAYGDHLNDLTYKATVKDYSSNTYFCPAMRNGIKGFSAQSEADTYPAASLAPYFVTEYAEYGHSSVYAHMAKGAVKIVHYFNEEMMNRYNALISEYNTNNGKSYSVLTPADLSGAGDAFDDKYNAMLEDYASIVLDGTVKNNCFVWLQGEGDGDRSYIEYKLKMQVLWEHLQSLGFTHFFVLRVGFWGNTGVLNVIKAQEDFCAENENCYIVTRAPSLIPHSSATTENWWISEPSSEYDNCRDSYLIESSNHHFNEKAMQIFAERSAQNVHRILHQGLDPILEEENIQGMQQEQEENPDMNLPEDTTPCTSYLGTDTFCNSLSVSQQSNIWKETASSSAASTNLIPVTSADSVWIQYVFFLSEAHAVGGFYDKEGNLVAPLYYKDFGFSLGGGGGESAFRTPETTNRISVAAIEAATGKEIAFVRFTAWQASAGGHTNTEARIYHTYTPVVTGPTCMEQGYTTYTCACGDSYVDSYVEATGHHYENGICAACGVYISEPAWERGTIASVTGANDSTNSRMRTVGYVKLTDFAGVGIHTGFTMTNFVYDENHVYLGTSSWLGDGIPFTAAELQEKYPSGVYFRVAFRALDQRNLTDADIEASGVKFYLPGEEIPVPDFGFDYENVGNIGVWQDGAIWDGKLFALGAAGSGAVFDVKTGAKLGNLTLDEKDVLKPHANSVCFGNTYYAQGDPYPLLYVNIYNNYASEEDRMEGTCCVYRITESEKGFETELVQVIKIGFVEDLTLWKSKENNGDVRPYGNFVVDTDNNKLYAYVMRDANKTTRFFGFDIPGLNEGTFDERYGCNVVTLESSDIRTQFDCACHYYLQGSCYSSGMILYMGDFGGDAPLCIVDLESQTITDVVCLGYAGLRAEPEVLCADPADGTLYYAAADGVLRKITLKDTHLHAYQSITTAPTCTELGYTTHTCSVCGDSYVDSYVAAKGHTEVTDKAVSATCTTTGKTEGKHCSVCNTVIVAQKEVPAKGHTEVTDKAVSATCTTAGKTGGKHCSACGTVLVAQKEIPAQGHSYGAWTVTTTPTCMEKGQERRDCANCDHSETRDVAAKGHTEVTDKAVSATCTTAGKTEGKHCSVCGTVLVAQNTIPAKGHTWDAGKVTKEPTEQTEGVKTFTCTVCGETKTQNIPVLSHTHKYTSKVTVPTCTEQGYTTYTCTCGDSYVDNYVKATGHSYGAWAVTTKPTCTEKGTERRDCNNCDVYETRDVAAKGHTEVTDNAVAATCTTTGLTEGKHCSVCNTVLVAQKEIPAKGHAWDNGKVTKEPTEQTEGMKTYTCTACGETKTETIPTLDHTHKYNAKETAPTCTAQGYTTYSCACGDSYVDNYVKATGHSYGTWMVTTKPTCTEKGTERRDCNNCDAYETREVAANGHTEVIDKAIAATCTTAGLTEGKHCSVCNVVLVAQTKIAALGHSWDVGVVTKEPTETEEGESIFTCQTCGETKIQKLPTLSHVHKHTAAVTAPTCIEQGYTTYTCSCGDSYVDEYVEAAGHEIGQWQSDKIGHWRVCAVCSEILDMGVHSGENCTICGHEAPEQGHGYQLGDVNHDNKINAKDATLILQKSVGVLKDSAKFCEDCAEVSGDGKLNAKDSTLILQFSVGLRETFPAEQ